MTELNRTYDEIINSWRKGKKNWNAETQRKVDAICKEYIKKENIQ